VRSAFLLLDRSPFAILIPKQPQQTACRNYGQPPLAELNAEENRLQGWLGVVGRPCSNLLSVQNKSAPSRTMLRAVLGVTLNLSQA
jgi:hypothetical protein